MKPGTSRCTSTGRLPSSRRPRGQLDRLRRLAGRRRPRRAASGAAGSSSACRPCARGRRCLAEVADRERRGVGARSGLGEVLGDRRAAPRLQLEVLGHRLDHEVAALDRGQPARPHRALPPAVVAARAARGAAPSRAPRRRAPAWPRDGARGSARDGRRAHTRPRSASPSARHRRRRRPSAAIIGRCAS